MQLSSSPNPFMAVNAKVMTGSSSGAVNFCSRRTRCFSNHLHHRLKLQKLRFQSFESLSTRIRNTISTCGSRYNARGLCDLIFSKCFNISWGLPSWIISVYLICLCFVAEAHNDQFSSHYYACENVQNYYVGLQHLRGEELKEKLNIIISKHQSVPYRKVWDAIKILDAADIDVPEASSEVVEIYSLRTVSKSLAGKPEGWNREHLWPRSFGLITHQSLTDLHNIRPADANVNSSRGNKYYGECNADSSHCLKPATKESAPDTETDKKRWAPPLQVRGDIARALMYMAVCYGFPESDGGVNLRLSDFPETATSNMGLLSTLLRWNNLDPPSREEKLRNERVCKLYQHNRNPFIDHPEYANLIWEQIRPNSKSQMYGLTNSAGTTKTVHQE